MIKTHYNESFACAMFQYALARILAGRFRYTLDAATLTPFPLTADKVSGEEIYGPACRWYGNWPIDYSRLRPIQQTELFHPPSARLILNGSFQRFELYAEHQDLIRSSWFRPRNAPPMRDHSDFLICLTAPENPLLGAVPINGTDQRMNDGEQLEERVDGNTSILTDEEVRRLARNVSYEKLFILTDQSQIGRVPRLKDLNAEFVLSPREGKLLFIRSFQKIAFGQNALQWWGAFLSEAREIYFPYCRHGVWCRSERPISAADPAHCGIDLCVKDDRYIYDW